jgi:hypothetical protein
MRPFLGFTDYRYRFEWQARGSGHLHCLFWIPTAPPLNQDTDDSRAEFARSHSTALSIRTGLRTNCSKYVTQIMHRPIQMHSAQSYIVSSSRAASVGMMLVHSETVQRVRLTNLNILVVETRIGARTGHC